MADISHKGLWIRWGSLGVVDKLLFGSSLSFALMGGGLLGFSAGLRVGGGQKAASAAFGQFDGMAGATSFTALVIGLAIYGVFVARQDELFRRLNELSVLWGGVGLFFATGLAISLKALGYNWFAHEHALLLGSVFAAAGYLYHYRKLY